jgi:energy-converting hydrogenase A subunit M
LGSAAAFIPAAGLVGFHVHNLAQEAQKAKMAPVMEKVDNDMMLSSLKDRVESGELSPERFDKLVQILNISTE